MFWLIRSRFGFLDAELKDLESGYLMQTNSMSLGWLSVPLSDRLVRMPTLEVVRNRKASASSRMMHGL